jgi:hypothetical protein
MPIKSFRSLIANKSVDTISLSTNNGSTGYRINKLQVIEHQPGQPDDHEFVIQVYSIPKTTPTYPDSIDFSNQTLLAAAYLKTESSGGSGVFTDIVIFDNMLFNQDIYITCVDNASDAATQPCNYYIELEQIKLDLNENTVATLKDIKNIEASYL